MGDMGEIFNAMRAETKERHQRWYEINRAYFVQHFTGRFIEKGTTYLLRESGKPKVDFYPHTGRWKAGNKMHRGGAIAFHKWYQGR